QKNRPRAWMARGRFDSTGTALSARPSGRLRPAAHAGARAASVRLSSGWSVRKRFVRRHLTGRRRRLERRSAGAAAWRPSPHYRPSLLQIVWGITGQIYRETVCGAIHVGRSTGCTRRRKTRRGAVDVESSRVVPAAPGATSLRAPKAADGGGHDGQAVRGCAAADPCPGGSPGDARRGDGATGAG